jgi:hypothetical protein
MINFFFPSPLASINTYPSTPPDTQVEIIGKKSLSSSTPPFYSLLPLKDTQQLLSSKQDTLGDIRSLRIREVWEKTKQERTTFCYDSSFSRYPMSPDLAICVIEESHSGSTESIIDRASKKNIENQRLKDTGWVIQNAQARPTGSTSNNSSQEISRVDSWETEF